MSEKHYTKSPTSFLLNRFSLNKLTQNGTKKRIEKEIAYFKIDDPEPNGELTPKPHDPHEFEPTKYTGSDFHGNNQGLDDSVDNNYARIYDAAGVAMEPTNAKLRIVTPGANGFGCQGGFYIAPSIRNGLSASKGLSASVVNTISDETIQLDKGTFIKVDCGITPVIRAYKTSPGSSVFYKYDSYNSEHHSIKWSDGASTPNYVHTGSSFYDYCKDAVIYNEAECSTALGTVDACYVTDAQPAGSPMLAGFFRSLELDETVVDPGTGVSTKYYGWFFIGNSSNTEFTQVYTLSDTPESTQSTPAAIYLRDTRTGNFVEFPTADFKVAKWSAPATMFDVDYEFDYTPVLSDDDVLTPGKKVALAESNDDVVPIHIQPANNHYHYNLRALLAGYDYTYHVATITVDAEQEDSTTYSFDCYLNPGNPKSKVRWTTSTADTYAYTWDRDPYVSNEVFSDEACQTQIGQVSARTLETTADEKVMYMAYAAPTGVWSNPDLIFTEMTPDYTSAKRREMVLDEYMGINLTPYIEKKYWNTANLGYGEVSSQTTLYTETVFRYKDLDAHLSQYLPADWEGSAYGCIIMATSSNDQHYEQMFFGISHSDFFADGSDVYYIIPTNTVGTAGQNGPYDLIHAYVYDSALRSIYGTTFAIDTLNSGVRSTHHYVSDSTGNYQKDGAWRYHYACVEDKTKDIWAKRLAYDFSDLYYLVGGVEVALDSTTQTLVTPVSLPYSTIYEDDNVHTSGICAWYDFAHTDITALTGFGFTTIQESETLTWNTTRANNYDTTGPDSITDNSVVYTRHPSSDVHNPATVTAPLGESTAVFTRYSDLDITQEMDPSAPAPIMYCWNNYDAGTGTEEYVFTASATPSTGDTAYNGQWAEVGDISNPTSEQNAYAWNHSGTLHYTYNELPVSGDTTYTYDSSTHAFASAGSVTAYTAGSAMYAWYGEWTSSGVASGSETVYTNTLTPVQNTTKVWRISDHTWSEAAIITRVDTTTTTWYRFHTSVKESCYIDILPTERFAVVWATNRDFFDYHENTLVHSNYDAIDQTLPTTPNINNPIEYSPSYQCYIAPAYEMEVTYQNEDWTFHTDFSQDNFEFRGILYTRWVCDENGGPTDVLYTARITPRVGDKLYVNNNTSTSVATGYVIKSVTSVTDLIYPGRA